MFAPRLLFRDALYSGKCPLATFMLLKGARAAQVMTHLGLEGVVVDCEHGNSSDSDMHDMVSIIAASGASPLVRVPGPDPTILKRALDTGTHGIIVPAVNTAKDARDLVTASKFPPLGVRGQGSPFACFSLGLSTPNEYVKAANDSVLLIAQTETATAVENVEDICNVEGIDAVLVGPNDLALSVLGYCPARGDEPAYTAAIEKIRVAARKANKKVGMVTTDGAHCQRLKHQFDFFILTADVRALQTWYRGEVAIARAKY